MRRRSVLSSAVAAATVLAGAAAIGPAVADPHGGVRASAPTSFATAAAPGSKGQIALTFDDGPDPVMTPRVLDALRRNGIKATFFVEGSHAARYPSLVRRIQAEGHTIGNHSYTHPDFTTLDASSADREIVRTNRTIAAITGTTPTLFRYPYGSESEAGNTVIRREGMWGGVLWHWTENLPGDFECPGAQGVTDYISANATDQALILLHDGNEARDCGTGQLRYLDQVIPQLKAQGFTFGVVDVAWEPSTVNQQSWVKVVPPSSARG